MKFHRLHGYLKGDGLVLFMMGFTPPLEPLDGRGAPGGPLSKGLPDLRSQRRRVHRRDRRDRVGTVATGGAWRHVPEVVFFGDPQLRSGMADLGSDLPRAGLQVVESTEMEDAGVRSFRPLSKTEATILWTPE